MSESDNSITTNIVDILRNKEQSECIFRERVFIVHARIKQIKAETKVLRIYLEDLQTPGFVKYLRRRFDLGVFWEEVHSICFESDHWFRNQYPLWDIYFSESKINAAKEIAYSNYKSLFRRNNERFSLGQLESARIFSAALSDLF